MLNCDKLSAFLDELSDKLWIRTDVLKTVLDNIKDIKKARDILAEAGYKKSDLSKILDEGLQLSSKYSDDLYKYMYVAKLGSELRSMVTSHTMAAISNAVNESIYSNAAKIVEEALASKSPKTILDMRIRELEEALSKTDLDSMIIDKEILDQLKGLVNMDWRKLKKALWDLKQELDLRKAYFEMNKKDWAYTLASQADSIEAKMVDDVYFVNKATLQKERSIANQLLEWKTYYKLRDVFNDRIAKYQDFVDKLHARQASKDINAKIKEIKEVVQKINENTWRKADVKVSGDLVIIKSENGIMALPIEDLWLYQPSDIRRFFANIDWEMSAASFWDEVENSMKMADDDIADNIDQASMTMLNWVPDGMTAEQAQKALEHIEAEIHSLESQADDLVNAIIDRIWNMNQELSGKMKHHLTTYLLEYAAIRMFWEGLLTNLELLKERNPELYAYMQRFNMFSDAVLREIGNAYVQAHRQITKAAIADFKNDLPYWVVRELWIELPEEYKAKIIEAYKAWQADWVIKFLNELWYIDDIGKARSQYRNTYNRLRQSFAHDGRWAVMYLQSKYWGIANAALNAEAVAERLANLLAEQIADIAPGVKLDEIVFALTRQYMEYFNDIKNFTTFLTKVRSSMQALDQALLASTGNFLNIQLSRKAVSSYFAYALEQTGIVWRQAERIISDLYWHSFWADNGFWSVIGKMRAVAYQFLTNIFSLKWLWISAQNFVFQSIEWATLYKPLSDEAGKILKLLNEIEDPALRAEIEEMLWRGFYWDDIFQSEAVKWLEEQRQPLYIKLAMYLDALTKSTTPSKIAQWIMNAPAVADKLSDIFVARDAIVNAIIDELWLSAKGFEMLVKEANAGNRSAAKRLKQLVTRIKELATTEYQQFYKAADHSGFTRNSFSRYVSINFFSSWWSKKLGEYVYNLFAKPIKSYRFHAKLGWHLDGAAALARTFLEEPRLHALMKQVYLMADMMYNIDKGHEEERDNLQLYAEGLTIWQAFVSFVLTRGLANFLEGMQADAPLDARLMYAISRGFETLSKNFMREAQLFLSLPGSGIWAGLSTDWDVKAMRYNMSNWALTNTMNTFLYNMYDFYWGIYKPRLDRQEELGVIEGLLWLPLTQRWDKKWELYRIKKIYQAMSNPKQFFNDMFTFRILGNFYGRVPEYIDKESRKILDADINLQRILGKWIMPESWYYNKTKQDQLRRVITRSDLLSDRDLDKSGNVFAGELQLVFKELQMQWVDPQTIIDQLTQAKKLKEKDAIRLAAIAKTKAASSVLVAYAMQQERKQWINNNKKAWEVDKTLKKGEILEKYLPLLMWFNKQVHSDMAGLYIKETYKDKWIVWKLLKNTKLKNALMLRLFAEVVDSNEADFDEQVFLSVPVLMSKDVNNDNLLDFIGETWGMVNTLPVSNQTKLMLKAAMLYANLDKAKDIISQYDKYWVVADKVAELIWDVNDQLTHVPDLWGWVWRIRKIKSPKWTQTAKKIKDSLIETSNDLLSNGRLRNAALTRIYSKLNMQYKPFKYNIQVDELKIWRPKLKWFTSPNLNTASKKLKPKRWRLPWKISS